MEVPVIQIIGRICHFCDRKHDTHCITDGSFERKAHKSDFNIRNNQKHTSYVITEFPILEVIRSSCYNLLYDIHSVEVKSPSTKKNLDMNKTDMKYFVLF